MKIMSDVINDEQIRAQIKAVHDCSVWSVAGEQFRKEQLRANTHLHPLRLRAWCLSRPERDHVYGCKECQQAVPNYWFKLLNHRQRELWRSLSRRSYVPYTLPERAFLFALIAACVSGIGNFLNTLVGDVGRMLEAIGRLVCNWGKPFKMRLGRPRL